MQGSELADRITALAGYYADDNPVRIALDRLAADLKAGAPGDVTVKDAQAALDHLSDPGSTAHRFITAALAELEAAR